MWTIEAPVKNKLQKTIPYFPRNCEDCLDCVTKYRLTDLELVLRRFSREKSIQYGFYMDIVTNAIRSTNCTPQSQEFFIYQFHDAYLNGLHEFPTIETRNRIYFSTDNITADRLLKLEDLSIDLESAAMNHEVLAYFNYLNPKDPRGFYQVGSAYRTRPYNSFSLGDFEREFHPDPNTYASLYEGISSRRPELIIDTDLWKKQIIDQYGSKVLPSFEFPPDPHIKQLPYERIFR